MLAFLAARPDGCLRECVPGHVTGSALVLDHTGTHALLTLHPRFGRWLQLGGHCEETDADIVAAALREATEESGIDDLTIDPELAALHVHPVTCSLGVPTRHLDMQFIVHAPAAPKSPAATSLWTCGGGRWTRCPTTATSASRSSPGPAEPAAVQTSVE